MRFALVLVFALGCTIVKAHDLQISLFEVGKMEKGHISLFVRLDKEDILKELYDSCDDYGQVNECLADYINSHFALKLGQATTTFDLIDLKHTKDFVEANLVSLKPFGTVSHIELFNDVLVKSKPQQENIVRFSLNDQFRSFRMNKDRITTTITYN